MLVDAQAVADALGVTRGFVYEHAVDLGAVRLGSGPRARLRFRLDEVETRLTACTAGRGSESPVSAPVRACRPAARRHLGTKVDLLPVRGRKVPL